MTWNWKKSNKQKHQFKGGIYCVNCQQRKSCGLLDEKKKYCCSCYRKILEELEWDRLLISSAQQLLNDYRQRVIICQCLESKKVRATYLNSDGSGFSSCERCEKIVSSAGHHRVIKNRNDVRFWGVSSSYKILCLRCIGKEFYKEMVGWQRKKWREYIRREYV